MVNKAKEIYFEIRRRIEWIARGYGTWKGMEWRRRQKREKSIKKNKRR